MCSAFKINNKQNTFLQYHALSGRAEAQTHKVCVISSVPP